MSTTAERTLRILAEAADTPRVFTEPDLPIFELGLLDSLGTVTLIAQLSEEFGVDISPAEFQREDWATPAKIVQDMERRAGA
jgi:D-alanine--poly(phosphoribitol) ligase subunit 2